MKTTPHQVLIPRTVAAQLLGVSVASVKRLARRGVLEEIRLHPTAHVRLRLGDVLELADGQRGSP